MSLKQYHFYIIVYKHFIYTLVFCLFVTNGRLNRSVLKFVWDLALPQGRFIYCSEGLFIQKNLIFVNIGNLRSFSFCFIEEKMLLEIRVEIEDEKTPSIMQHLVYIVSFFKFSRLSSGMYGCEENI